MIVFMIMLARSLKMIFNLMRYTGKLNSLMNIKDNYLLYSFEIILIPIVSSSMETV